MDPEDFQDSVVEEITSTSENNTLQSTNNEGIAVSEPGPVGPACDVAMATESVASTTDVNVDVPRGEEFEEGECHSLEEDNTEEGFVKEEGNRKK